MTKNWLILLLIAAIIVALILVFSGSRTTEAPAGAGEAAVQDVQSELGSLQLESLESEFQDLDQAINQL